MATLTSQQLATLKANIIADSAFNNVPMNSDGHALIAAAYALTASPDFWVWRSKVTKSEFVNSVSVDATTFNWVGNGFITRTAGEQAAWAELFNGEGTVNPSLANVRQAFADIFSGTGNAAANRAHMLAIGRRKANRGERLFATGTGSTASPGLAVFEGTISAVDFGAARELP